MVNLSRADTTKRHVFVVEDEAVVARDILSQIEDLGFVAVGHATTGEEALAKLRETPADLVLMDISLGGELDGISTALALRAELSIPCVFLTAYSSAETLNRAKLVEPLGYVLKPFTERELQTVLEMACYRATTESRLRLMSAALAAVSQGVTIAGPDRKIISANRAFCRMFGYEEAEVIGRDYGFLHGPQTSEESKKEIREALDRDGNYTGEILNYRKDGTALWNELTVSVVLNYKGGVSHYIGIAHDVTERKRMIELDLNAQRMQAIGSMAGGVAHDLNNILAPIMAMPFILKDWVKPGGERFVNIIANCAQRGADTLKQLLIFSRGAEGKRGLVRVPLLIREIVQLMRETFPRELQISSDYDSSIPPVFADATQLHLVLLNLCVNARDAMPAGGRLLVEAKVEVLEEKCAPLPRDFPGGTYVIIEVTDTGHGISPEIREKIFDPYFSTKPVGKGTGLGLSTVHGIVRSHFGFIRVKSEVGQGTIFQVFLPAEKGSIEASNHGMVEAAKFGKGELVLVVDDEESILETIRGILEVAGYRVVTAANGQEALGAFAEHQSQIRLVVTDMMMPVLDGPGLVREIRRVTADVPIVALSGLASGDEAAFSLITSPIQKLDKPIEAGRLLELVDEIIRPRAIA